jgi:hypothetical protein
MPKGKVLHHQRVIGRIFRAATAAKYPVEEIEFTADGTIIVRPGKPADVPPVVEDDEKKWDKAIHAAHVFACAASRLT